MQTSAQVSAVWVSELWVSELWTPTRVPSSQYAPMRTVRRGRAAFQAELRDKAANYTLAGAACPFRWAQNCLMPRRVVSDRRLRPGAREPVCCQLPHPYRARLVPRPASSQLSRRRMVVAVFRSS